MQPDLFTPGNALWRTNDRQTSIEAGESVAPSISELQTLVLHTLKTHGPMTDEQLENHFEVGRFAQTTMRKRRTDLFHLGLVDAAGKVPNSRGRFMILWKAK